MKHYEVTFIVDPVLSGDEVKATAQKYADMLVAEGASIVHVDEMGLRQLAYTIKKRHSGVYFCIEYTHPTGAHIPKVDLAMRRDEQLLRFLTIALDKFGVKFNADKRAGLIGKKNREAIKAKQDAADAAELEEETEA